MRSHLFDHISTNKAISKFAVVFSSSDSADDSDFLEAMLAGDFFGSFNEFFPETEVLRDLLAPIPYFELEAVSVDLANY